MKTIRPLTPKDAKAFAELRLGATRANPECFCTSIAEVQAYDVDFYRDEIHRSANHPYQQLLGCFINKQLVGSLGIERLHGELRQHRGRLWGLMVTPDHRRQGVARSLCEEGLALVKDWQVEKLGLELTGSAIAAMQLYRSLGFRIETVEPMALKLDGHYLDEIHMGLCL